jgi:hypothetical protein
MTTEEKLRTALKLHDDTLDLIEYSTRWLNDADRWGSDDHLGPMWESIYTRRGELSK